MPNLSFLNLLRLLILLFFVVASYSASAQIPDIAQLEETPVTNMDEIPADEVESYLAVLTDSQIRKLMMTEMKKRSVPKEPSMMDSSYISYALMSLSERSTRFETEFKKILDAKQHYVSSIKLINEILFINHGVSTALKAVITIIILLVVGWLVIAIIYQPLRPFRKRLSQKGDYPHYIRLGHSLVGIALDLSKSGLFVVMTVLLTFLFFDKFDPVRILASSVLIMVAVMWTLHNILKEMLFRPACCDLFISDQHCRRIYYWSMMGFFTPTVLSFFLKSFLDLMGFESELIRLNTLTLSFLSISSLIIGVLLIAREKFRQRNTKPDILSVAVTNNKYWLIVAALLGFYFIGFRNIVAGNVHALEGVQPHYNYYALLMFIFLPMYLRVMYFLISIQSISIKSSTESVSESMLEEYSSPSGWERIIFVAPYVLLIFLFAMESAGIGLLSWFSRGAGANYGQAATSIFISVMLGVLAWKLVNDFIYRNLPEIAIDPSVLMNSEAGGDKAATRMQTVLPIIRNFALATIVVIVSFSILSSIGANTAPLLAGAGVMGLAIGFGAQKLVQDVVSGVFFLFEDAFRIGEYIDTGELVGTVESTSVRSLRLRHHLGAVQTIPYGEIRAVKNLSRDFVIMKLKFRVPFDTDIEVVRKTIKKVGQELLEHDELGKDFISPLKSQGVQSAEDDALVIRMKFTSKPNKQWMIKREAYRLVQEALASKGIHFASRQVTVHVPESENMDSESIKKVAGAAAISADTKTRSVIDPLMDR